MSTPPEQPASADDIPFDRAFDGPHDTAEQLTPLVRRLVANNGGPFCFTGTCSYIIGTGKVAILDPGPPDEAHVDALLAAVRNETVTHVVVTHTHRDHSPAAAAIKARTGALVVGCAPYRRSQSLAPDQSDPLDAAHDHDYAPDRILADGEPLDLDGPMLTAIATPGHASNHLAFALEAETALFSGDHVMAWSTSIVAPPDGNMRDYMASLDKLRGRGDTVYWPGHGGPVKDPPRLLRALVHHRRQREASILNRLAAGDRRIPAIVERIYEGLNPALAGAAALSVFAHMEDLVARGLVRSEGPAALDAIYAKARAAT